MSLSAELASRIRDGVPVALATVISGPGIGSKMLVAPDGDPAPASLGDSELDRVVRRDALAELEAGRSGVTEDRFKVLFNISCVISVVVLISLNTVQFPPF